MARIPAFHSRHIPAEQVNFETPRGKDVRRNGLCDTLEPDVLKRLRDHGVDLIETRLAWWDFEPEPNRFDWSRIERDVEKIETAGMRVGLFPWPQHPPDWYNKPGTGHVRYRCLEHHRDSTILSLWDPKTLDVYDRILGAIAERLGERLHMVYAGISGDFGEVSTITGEKHYKFSPAHGHWGFWSGDLCARKSFSETMQECYASLDDLNRTWGSRFCSWSDDLMPQMPLADNSLRHRHDYMSWYTGSVMSFTDRVCAIYRRHFRNTQLSLPIGHPNEHLCLGQVKSQAAKIAAKHGMTARWTGCGYLLSFPRSNVLARRVASAAHFYGTSFGTEAALILEKENAANALYEGLANGASQIHDDPQNILRASDVHRRLRPELIVDPPVSPIAVYYPMEAEMLETTGFDIEQFIGRCASFRAWADYDLCDTIMISEDYLRHKSDLLLLASCHIPESLVDLMTGFIRAGGRIWIHEDAHVKVLHTSAKLDSILQDQGQEFRTGQDPGLPGFYRFKDWPHLAPYASLTAEEAEEPVYWTVHRNHVSRFAPRDATFEVCQRES